MDILLIRLKKKGPGKASYNIMQCLKLYFTKTMFQGPGQAESSARSQEEKSQQERPSSVGQLRY